MKKNKLILLNKFYLILVCPPDMLEGQLRKIGNRIGFRPLVVDGPEQLRDALAKVKCLVGIIDCAISPSEIPAALQAKSYRHQPGADLSTVISWLNRQIVQMVPLALAQLIENAIRSMSPRLIDPTLIEWYPTFDFELPLTNLITCDTSAADFSGKALCEVDFASARAMYPVLNGKSAFQMIDAFGEVCNQILGVINEGLRHIGLDPLISLPMGVELSGAGNYAQVDFMPMIRMADRHRCIAIGVGIMIGKNSKVSWDKLVTTASEGSLEIL